MQADAQILVVCDKCSFHPINGSGMLCSCNVGCALFHVCVPGVEPLEWACSSKLGFPGIYCRHWDDYRDHNHVWRLTREWTVHCCESSLEPSHWNVSIRHEVEPDRGARRYDSAGGRQVTTEMHQQGNWGRRAVVNPQIIAARLCVEVRKHHLDRVATWHCEATAAVLVVGVIFRVVRARKSTRVLPTDGMWTNCGQSTFASVPRSHEWTNDNCRWRHDAPAHVTSWNVKYPPAVLTCRIGEKLWLMAKIWFMVPRLECKDALFLQ